MGFMKPTGKRKTSASLRFVCENCKGEVPGWADRCPHCGSSFEQVCCAVCDYVGEEAEFVQGCPKCGSQSPVHQAPSPPKSPVRETLPPWVYLLTLASLAAALLALLLRL
jgi:RNA polymerase subunit RPABC4/transcription elongation factor Spt4